MVVTASAKTGEKEGTVIEFETAEEAHELVLKARTGECSAQVQAIRRGLFSVIPSLLFNCYCLIRFHLQRS